MVVTLSGMSIASRLTQSSKAYRQIAVRVSGSFTSVRPAQPLNTPSFRTVTVSGTVTDFRPVQFWNA